MFNVYRSLTPLLLGCTAVAFSAHAQSLDGQWTGTMTCSENLANRGPGYSVRLSLEISGAAGRAERSDAQTLEIFTLRNQPSGLIELQSSGRLRTDTAPRWTTRFSGQATGAGRMDLTGQMFAADGMTLVRERCTVGLQRIAAGMTAPSTAPAADRLSPPQNTAAGGQDHRTLRIREVPPRARPLNADATVAGSGGLPRGEGDTLYLPEDWLTGTGQPWHYRTAARSGVAPVAVRPANADEAKVIEKAVELMQRIESRVLVLIADGHIVDVISTGGIRFDSHLLSASMAKTVTALAAGKAICAGKITLDRRADSVIAALAGTDLGAATLRDVLMMASGTTEPTARDYVGTTPAETRHYLEGAGNLEQFLATPGQSSAQRGIFSKVRPGEQFSYKARDPYTVAMMLERTTGMATTRWIEEQLLADIKTEFQAILGTDRSGFFHGANGTIRLTLIDWVRLAMYVDQQRRADTCFGRFVRDMGTTHIRAPGVTKGFNGYGYLTWTDNTYAPDSFWAVGYGGQRIGWSTDPQNQRIFLMFSNSADRDMDQVYPVARDWFLLGRVAK